MAKKLARINRLIQNTAAAAPKAQIYAALKLLEHEDQRPPRRKER